MLRRRFGVLAVQGEGEEDEAVFVGAREGPRLRTPEVVRTVLQNLASDPSGLDLPLSFSSTRS